jgi:hypothetical protein
MSYDLLVFDANCSPATREGFQTWWEAVSANEDDEINYSLDFATPELRDWLLDITNEFPEMNGPRASDDFDDPKLSDYSICRSYIYATFAWSQAIVAYDAALACAKKHGVGFFDISAVTDELWFPG